VLQRQHGGYPTPSQLVNVQVIVGVPFSTNSLLLGSDWKDEKYRRGHLDVTNIDQNGECTFNLLGQKPENQIFL